MSSNQETYRYAFPDSPPHISYGIPFDESCAKHVNQTFDAKRAYIIASRSLSRQTDNIKKLERALDGKVVGIRHGMTPHTLCSEVLEIIHDTREAKADLIITCGAGSLTDAAKIIALVTFPSIQKSLDLWLTIESGTGEQCLNSR